MQLSFSFSFHRPFFLLWHLIYRWLDINEPLVLSRWARVFGTSVKLVFACSTREPSSGDFSTALNSVWETGHVGRAHLVVSGTVTWSGGVRGAAHPKKRRYTCVCHLLLLILPVLCPPMFHQNKIVSAFFWDKLCWAQWEDEKYFPEVYSALFFDSTAIIHNWFSSILASSTLFLLSHIVAYFSVSCHLFRKILQSLPTLLLFIAPGQHHVTTVFALLDHDLWLLQAIHLMFIYCSYSILQCWPVFYALSSPAHGALISHVFSTSRATHSFCKCFGCEVDCLYLRLCWEQLTPVKMLAGHTSGQEGLVREENKDRAGL